MRWSSITVGFALVTPLVALLCATCAAAEFPYTAYVNSADVYVRSGPGKNYYPTDKLQKGEQVEVYRHDPGGWLAIRPPKGSYSWVSARQLEPTKKGLAKSKDNRVVCRVGSAFSDVRDVIQVRLEKGEVVELIGDTGAPRGAWYKIAPPSGEFRWISSKFVDHDHGPEDVASSAEPKPLEPAAGKPAPGKPAEWKGDGGVKLASGVEPIKGDAAASEPKSASGGAGLSPAEVLKQLDDLDVELSAMVAEEVTVWSFDRLREKAELALDATQTAIDRGRARLLLSKIDTFSEIKKRHDTIKSLTAETDRRNRELGETSRPVEQAPRFDGAGRLAPVMSRKVGAPQYALIDGDGAVLSFLTSAPSVNLRPYLDKQVGVNGARTFSTELQKQLISVQRVTLLEGK